MPGGEFNLPSGYFEDPHVRYEFGLGQLAHELSIEDPDTNRVQALRRYTDTQAAQVARIEGQQRSAEIESRYPEDEE